MCVRGFSRGSRTHRIRLPLAALRRVFAMALSERHREALLAHSHFSCTLSDSLPGQLWQLKEGSDAQAFRASEEHVLRVAMIEGIGL